LQPIGDVLVEPLAVDLTNVSRLDQLFDQIECPLHFQGANPS
jgi:hypothetical protein